VRQPGPWSARPSPDLAHEVLAAQGAAKNTVLAAAASLPGPVDGRQHRVGSFSILRSWAGIAARHRLAEGLGVPVVIDNDGNVEALAEARSGAAAGCHDVLHVKVSAGVGAGLVLGGRVDPAAGMAGELGHVTVDPVGRICRCGGRGCVETVAGIPRSSPRSPRPTPVSTGCPR